MTGRDSLSVDELARDSPSVDVRPFKDRCGSRGPHARKLELFSPEPARDSLLVDEPA